MRHACLHRSRLASICFSVLTSGLTAGLLFSCGEKAREETAASTTAASNNPASVYSAVHASLGATLLEQIALGQNQDAELARRQAEIDRLAAAASAGQCDFGADYSSGMETKLPYLEQQRALARVLAADAQRLAATGDKDAAAKRTAAVFRMSSQIGQSARTIIELLVAMAIAQLGCEVVEQSPALAQAAWKTDIQQAITEVQRNVIGRGPDVVRSEGDMMIAWVRSAPDGALVSLGMKKRTATERAAAADTLGPLFAEAAAAWKDSSGTTRLAAIDQKAKQAGVDDLFPGLVRLKGAFDKTSAMLAKTQTALAKQ